MSWNLKPFSDLTAGELYEILKLRSEVFVLEQSCLYQDMDSKDLSAFHLYFEENGAVLAYLRILPRGLSYPEASLGRVVTKSTARKTGLGRELLKRALTFAEDVMGETELRISAQAYLQNFYESLGFSPVSEVYLEDGIPHLEMLWKK